MNFVNNRTGVPSSIYYGFMLLMFLWVARVSPLTSFQISDNPILAPIYSLIVLILFVKYNKNQYNKYLFLFIGLLIIWFILICFKYLSFDVPYLTLLYNLIIAHVAINIYDKDKFMFYYEKVLVHLCLLSLFVWLLCNILPSFFPSIMHSIAVVENHPPTETNSIFVGMGTQFVMGIRRNIGFTWEPGRYSCFLLLGIYFNVLNNGFKFNFSKYNKNLFILLLGIFSTLSTTGFAVLAFLYLFVLSISKSFRGKYLLILLGLFLLPLIWIVFEEKILYSIDVQQEVHDMTFSFDHNGTLMITPQRFTGLYLDFLNFIHDPLLGYNLPQNQWIQINMFNGCSVWLSDGVFQIVSKYGLFVGGFFYFLLFKSSFWLSGQQNSKAKFLFSLLFIFMSFSYDFWENCLFLFLILYPYYNKYQLKK